LSSSSKFIEGERIILENFSIPLLYELEIKRSRTHRWMKIVESKKIEDIALMEEKVSEMGKELSDLRGTESMKKDKL